ncbi:hypothetical protein EVB87_109 [Rhizobium phage RHph_N28_1]|nr:hypothetical protein EVB87_109 [Rhizobium phage RHph_N28_1]QIG74137.1 hypothetical protein EVC07_109 [Rhizobium phage RHph_N42]QXV73796.1 hypothetical protein [Rhizobium phage RHph_N46]
MAQATLNANPDWRKHPLFEMVVEENMNAFTAMFAAVGAAMPENIREEAEKIAVRHLERVHEIMEKSKKNCEVDPTNVPRIKIRSDRKITAVATPCSMSAFYESNKGPSNPTHIEGETHENTK